MFKEKSKASAISEYALILGTVFLSLVGMNTYLKRGIQARVKDLTTHFIVQDLYEGRAQVDLRHQFVAGNSISSADITFASSQTQQTTNQQTTDNVIQGTTRSANETSVAEGWNDLLPTPTL